jgi:hypothetical protein
MSDVLIKALELGAQGYPVFPVAASKRPTCPQGFKDAAIEPREIRRLWRDHPAPLIGVPTGEASGLFVLDIDSPKHVEAAEWFERYAPYLPETRQQTTRSGGTHLFFNHNQGLRNTAGRIARGIDTRAEGGYIIAWQSEAWQIRPLADIPAWLIKAATPPPPPVVQCDPSLSVDSARRKVEGIVGAVAAAQAGQRNSLAFWGACRLAELVKQRILAERDAIALGLEAARQAGLSPKEANRTISSAFRGKP